GTTDLIIDASGYFVPVVPEPPSMVSATVTATSIAITYDEAVSCDPTGADGAFAYFSSGTTSGGAATGCTTSGDVLTLAGTFTLPTGDGSIVYTAPATSTTTTAVYATAAPTVFAATQTLAVAAVPTMESGSVTTTSIAITYNEGVSCAATGVDGAFAYFSSGTTAGGTATGCTSSGDVLTLAGTFTLPTGTGSITYTPPASSTTSNAVYDTLVPTEFAANEVLQLRPVPAMVSASVTTSAITIDYNISVTCKTGGTAYQAFTYDSATSTPGGTITGCTAGNGDVLTLAGTFTLPTATASIVYTAPPTPSTITAVYATSYSTDFAATQTLELAVAPIMESTAWTASTIQITYNELVSCDMTGADTDFTYNSATSTSGGTITGCTFSGDALTLSGSFTLPTGSGTIGYTEPATPSTSNAVYSTAINSEFAPSGSLPVRPMPTMLSATVTATSITITYNTAVSCSPSGGADGDFAYDFSTSTSGGTVTSCHHTNAVLTLDGSFSVPTGTASITYTEPASPSVTNAVYSTAVPTDFEATETLLDANIS
ncbi:MAG: hypothetical protein ACRDX8_09780, partial [Acidimicrobiales bacterium]